MVPVMEKKKKKKPNHIWLRSRKKRLKDLEGLKLKKSVQLR